MSRLRNPALVGAAGLAAALAGAITVAEIAMSPPPSCRLVAMSLEAAAARPVPADANPGVERLASQFLRNFADVVIRDGRSLPCLRFLIGL